MTLDGIVCPSCALASPAPVSDPALQIFWTVVRDVLDLAPQDYLVDVEQAQD